MNATALSTARPAIPASRPASGRQRLRAVPSQHENPEPLLLGERMRGRLDGAVRALLADESVVGLSDAARLAAVVALAKGCVERGRLVIWSGDLAQWLGVSVSMVSHKVLPPLRSRGAITTQVHLDDDGQPVAVRIDLEPVGRVRRARDVRHPLALSRDELSVLLRLCEALFGPGRTPRDKPAIPPGLLAERRGHGAATDRLALLLLVLSCRESGWLRLCSGSLKDPEAGRGAATLALLLRGGSKKVSPSAAGRVLDRLQADAVVDAERDGDGTLTGRVRLLPVAERFTATRAKGTPADGRAAHRSSKGAMHLVVSPAAEASPDLEDFREATAASSSVSESADRDLGRSQEPTGCQEGLVTAGTQVGDGGPEDSESADFHAPHTPMADVRGDAEEVGGLSGARAAGVTHRRPERASVREDAPAFVMPALRLVGAADDPLRGDQHDPSRQENLVRTAVVRLPREGSLARALAPVEDLWVRLENPSTRRFLLRHVRAALEAIAVWTGDENAPEALADRLLYRRDRQRRQGNPNIDDPVGWLLDRGLPQERQCAEQACDNGVLLGAERDCTTCDLRVEDRRSIRRVLIGQVVRQLPDATFQERREAIQKALREHATARAAMQADAARREAEAALRWEAHRPERAARAAAAEQARLAVPCADCGAEQAAGLCGRCGWRRRVAVSVNAGIDLMLAAHADLRSRASVRQVWEAARVDLQARRTAACTGLADQDGEIARGVVELAMQHAVDELRQTALDHCAASAPAVREADAAYAAVMRSRHRYASAAAAKETAVLRAEQARARAAEWLLRQQLARVSDLRARMGTQAVAAAQPGRDRAGEG